MKLGPLLADEAPSSSSSCSIRSVFSATTKRRRAGVERFSSSPVVVGGRGLFAGGRGAAKLKRGVGAN